jgi:putative DNA primase/helicase
LKYVLGSQQYFSELKSDSVVARKNINSANEARSDLAKLRGARAVWVSELNANQTLDQSLIKTLTGDKNMTCRYLHQNEFVMDITFKLFMATNEKVSIKDPTDGLWRRMRLIPLVNQIAESEKITDYAEKILIPEASGILNWMLDGYKKYQKDGLIVPSYIKKANREYRTNCDIIEDFIEDCCVVGPEHKVLRTTLHDQFKQWSFKQGFKTVFSSKAFNSQIDSKGYNTKKISGNRFFCGIDFRGRI